jgi:rubrerythrin
MSSNDIILGSLRNLAEIEKNAREVYRELYNELEDEELKEFIRELIKSEDHHKKLVEEAFRLIEEE